MPLFVSHLLMWPLKSGLHTVLCSLISSYLAAKPINPEKNQPQQQRRLCRQILLPRPRRLRPSDPWAMQQKLQQTGEGAGESPAP